MNAEDVWRLAFLVKLGRGEIVQDAATVADKAVDEWQGRFAEDFDIWQAGGDDDS